VQNFPEQLIPKSEIHSKGEFSLPRSLRERLYSGNNQRTFCVESDEIFSWYVNWYTDLYGKLGRYFRTSSSAKCKKITKL